MRIAIINKKTCIICNKSILFFHGYKCGNCNNYYHKTCLRDNFFLNSNNNKCIICQKFILTETSYLYEIVRCIIWEIIPGILLFGVIIGIFVYFGINK